MKKLSTSKSDKIIISYVLKIILSTIITLLVLSFTFSQLVLKMDLDLEYNKFFGVFICIIASVLIAFISVSGMKNNGVLLGIISEIPLIFYSLINLIFYNNNFIYFLIKFALILIIGAFIGYLRCKHSKKFKVK